MSELRRVKAKFGELKRAKRKEFPPPRQRLNETNERGVYVIYGPRDKALHVGGTPGGRRGLRQRLNDHLHQNSSFTEKSQYLRKHGGRNQKDRCRYVRDHCR
jgi:hypothetical protein